MEGFEAVCDHPFGNERRGRLSHCQEPPSGSLSFSFNSHRSINQSDKNVNKHQFGQ